MKPKFRAWVTDQGEPFMAVQGEPDIETLQSFMHHWGDQEKLMRFTGLKDKNGVEIYEGDMFEDERKWRAVVQWDEENARFLGVGSGFVSYVGKVPSVKVIGNIYETPELLGSEVQG